MICQCEIFETCPECRGTDRDMGLVLQEMSKQTERIVEVDRDWWTRLGEYLKPNERWTKIDFICWILYTFDFGANENIRLVFVPKKVSDELAQSYCWVCCSQHELIFEKCPVIADRLIKK